MLWGARTLEEAGAHGLRLQVERQSLEYNVSAADGSFVPFNLFFAWAA